MKNIQIVNIAKKTKEKNTKWVKKLLKKSVPIMSYFHIIFRGIETWKGIKNKNIRLHRLGSFVIINFENSHWFAVQKIEKNKALVFDSFGGKCIPLASILKESLRRLFSSNFKSIELEFVVSKSFILQKLDSLTFEEHVINFLLYSCKSMKKMKQIKNNYAFKLIKICSKLNVSCDMYVWNKIYNILHLAPKPSLSAVCGWYGNIIQV